jgi:hypothetical protein
VTASQAVVTRAPSTPPSRAKDDGAVRQSEQNGGFEDALDRADTSTSETARSDQASVEGGQPQDGGRPTLAGRGRASAEDANATDDTATEPSTDSTAAGSQIPVAQAPAFVLALAALSATGMATQAQTQDQATADSSGPAAPASGEAALTLVLNSGGPDANAKAQGPVMPGEVDPVAETLSLLGLSEDDIADVQAAVSQTTAKVVGQETHLAVSQKAPSAVETMAAELAQSPTPQAATGQKAPADASAGDAAQGDVTDAIVSGVTGGQASTSAAAFSDDGTDGGSGQERRQPEGGTTQQSASGTQNGVPLSSTAGGSTAVGGTSTDPAFQTYTDGLSPGSQIARGVTAEIADTDRTSAAKDGVLKVLHIELKPQNLGSVSVRMSLKDDVISLHMETSRHETAAAIEKERSALTSALKSAGYVVDEITTQAADPLRASGRIEAATNDASMSSFAQGESQGRSQAQQDSSSGRGQSGQRGADGDVSLTSSNAAGEGADGVSRQRTGGMYV